MKFLKILTVLAWLVTVVCVVFCILMALDNPFLSDEKAEGAVAVLVANERTGYNGTNINVNNGKIAVSSSGYSSFEFVTKEGKEITANFPWYFYSEEIGNEVNILYLKDQPEMVTIDDVLFHSIWIVFLGIFSFLGFVYSIIMTVVTILIGKSIVKKNGQIEENF